MCCVCFCVFVYVISNQSTSKEQHYVLDVSKLDALLHKTHIKVFLVIRYQGLTYIDPYYHQVKLYITCGVITHSAKKHDNRKSSGGWELEVIEKGGGGGGNIRAVFIK